MNETTASSGLRLFVGAVAGGLVGLLFLMVFYRREPPVPILTVLLAVVPGALIGALMALLAGGRRVSVFWPYLLVVFGLIAIMPWWWSVKMHSYLLLGTIYVNRARPETILRVFIPHLLVSLALAVFLTAFHRRLLYKSADNFK